MNLDSYFQRIGYDGPRNPTAETLKVLHHAHLLAVPFENLDIHLKRPIVLEESRLFDKIVNQRRGGFCYEQNGLFAAVLREMGFHVTMMEARVGAKDWETGLPFDHLTLLVDLEERWLADVGFGESFLEPLRFDQPNEQAQKRGVFRVQHDDIEGVYERQTHSGDWHGEYLFRLQPCTLAGFEPGSHHHQYSPSSHFTQQRFCTQANAQGRITLSDRRLIVTENGHRHEQDLENEAEFQRYLRDHFGITL